MKPDKLTVYELFQRERRYAVPLYQRSYVWTRGEQWELLWEDIERQADSCLAEQPVGVRRSHFLGAIVLNVAKIVGSAIARSEVIDGQQRLITLQLFLAALRDFAGSIDSIHVKKVAKLAVHEDEPVGAESSFKVWPTNSDRDVFAKVMTAGSPQALKSALGISSPEDAPSIAAAYLYFHTMISEYVKVAISQEGRDARVFALYQALRTSLQLIVIELEDGDDPQVIFETLNARGQPLLPSDLIRNLVFLQAATTNETSSESLYEKYWRPLDERRQSVAVNGEDRFWKIEERQGRLYRPRIDLFLFHYLVMKTERDLNIGQIFREFVDWRASHPEPIERFLSDLSKYSDVFAELISPNKVTSRTAGFSKCLRVLDISTVYPLLMYLVTLPETLLPKPSLNLCLDCLESWLVRRHVCQLTNKAYNRFFVALLSKVKSAGDGPSMVNAIIAELERSSDPTARWPDDAEFRDAWRNKPIYVQSRANRSAMLLYAIEMGTRTSRNEAISLPDGLTVEHLLPQKGSLADYPYPIDLVGGADEAPERVRARVIHTIGNLTLLTQPLNSSVSNGSFSGKAAAIRKDSDLRLNAWLREREVTTWSESDIFARADLLFATAKLLWRAPLAGGVTAPNYA